MKKINKLEIIKSTRKFTAQSLLKAFSDLLKTKRPISESMLRNAWLAELRKNKDIFPDGWYTPPPHGIAVLFGTDKNLKRISPMSLRPQQFWSRDDIFLDTKNGIAMVYASPVNKQSGIIGDFGLTLYFGKNKKLQQHLQQTLQTNLEIFDYAQDGMGLYVLNAFCHRNLAAKGLTTNLSSLSDPTGTNIGHTIPVSYDNWSAKERALLQKGKWDEISTMISKKRVFLNAIEKLRIRKGMAFTIEPRPEVPNDPTIPMVLFHTIALFKENGEKELLTDFDELFALAGMHYMKRKY